MRHFTYRGQAVSEYIRPEFVRENGGYEFSCYIHGVGYAHSHSLRGIKSKITRAIKTNKRGA